MMEINFLLGFNFINLINFLFISIFLYFILLIDIFIEFRLDNLFNNFYLFFNFLSWI